jgi:hypothetical protein
MADSYPGFSATQFREAIVFAMNMGTPSVTSQQASFAWSKRRTYAIADPGDDPFDWDATPVTNVVPDPVSIPCAIEYGPGVLSETTPFGTIDPMTGTVTVLDEHYPSLFDTQGVRADLVIVDGNTYDIQFEQPPIGLFDVTVHQFQIQARDET